MIHCDVRTSSVKTLAMLAESHPPPYADHPIDHTLHEDGDVCLSCSLMQFLAQGIRGQIT